MKITAGSEKIFPAFSIAGLALAAALSGCAASVVNPRYQPTTTPTPISGARPSVFLGAVVDRSGGVREIHDVKSGDAYPTARPMEEVLREAFMTSFERLGVSLARTAAEADAQISATLKSAVWTSFAAPSSRNPGAMELSVSVRDRNGAVITTENVTGQGMSRGSHPGCCPGSGPSEAIDAALDNLMTNFEDRFANNLADKIAKFSAPAAAPAAATQAARSVDAVPVRSDVDEVPRGASPRRKGHALVIGIEHYREQLPRADFAAGDAKLVGKYVTQTLGYPAENVVVLTNENAARSDVEKYVERWLPNRVEAGDSVFIYFSGHGSPNAATGDAYLVPYDGDPTYLDQTAYPLRRLYGALAKLPTKDVTVVLDSCFSGAGGRSVLAKGARPLVTVETNVGIPESMTVLSAAGGNQLSQSYQEKGHGLFTYYFLKGLGQQAGQPAVNMRKVFEFAAPEVSRISRQNYNNDQFPQWHGGRIP